MGDYLAATLMGLIEGLTEFIPVSSTGHLLLVAHFLGFEQEKTFEVVIQLGAILAIVALYAAKLWQVFSTAHRDPAALRFIASVTLAFIPAVVFGVLAHDFIKSVLFESPRLIAVMLVLGGVVLVFLDRIAPPVVNEDATTLPFRKALIIGLFQCLSLVPGVSRSGATIVGARLIGVSRRASAEFSFFLSIPTMLGAVAYDLLKSRDVLDFGAVSQIGVGFVVAFVSGFFVVKWALDYISRSGFALFGWWRIIVGFAALAAIWAGY